MKTSTRVFRALLPAIVLLTSQRMETILAQGIPEPSLIFYGTIRNTAQFNVRMTSGNLTWQIRNTNNNRTINLSTSVTNLSGFSYLLQVPCETIVAGPTSSNALALSATTAPFDRSQVFFNGSPVTFSLPTQRLFSASSLDRGRIEEVDLTISISCADIDGNGICDDWELAYFGYVGVDPNGDADGDGMSNRNEYLAGTDPTDPNSVFEFIDIRRISPSTSQLLWQSADGRSYTLLRSTNLLSSFVVLKTNLYATPPVNAFLDTNSPFGSFYRLRLE